MRERVLRCSWIVWIALAAVGCPTNPPADPEPETEPPPFFRFKRISNGTPAIGELVEIEWEYGQDVDPDFPQRVENQVVELRSLTLSGDVFIETFGCYPPQLVFHDPEDDCLDLELRELSFEFRGPVMLRFLAWDTDPNEGSGFWREELVIKLRLPDTSLRADVTNLQTPDFPQIGLAGEGFASLDFERVFGVYEVQDAEGNEDGLIDDLGPDSPLAALFPSIVESLTEDPSYPVFFGRSTSPFASERFGFQRGSNFPRLPERFFESPEGATFSGKKDLADVVIFAGTIGVYGQRETFKTDVGEIEVIDTQVNLFRPIFLQIDLRSADISPPQWLLSDLHLGTFRDGLVVSAFLGHDPLEPSLPASFSATLDLSQPVRVAAGQIKDALVGGDVVGEDGVSFTPAQARISVEWTDVPVYPDDDLSGLEQTFVRFGPD